MNIAFRTDASLKIGSGHVMRCLTLANALKDRGTQSAFVCRKHDGHLMSLIKEQGHAVVELPALAGKYQPPAKPKHAEWLGCDWHLDADQTQSALGPDTVDWLVVDHYALDRQWHETMRPYARHLMVIDDLADRPLDCDVLLNQNFGSSATHYQGLLPSHCIQRHGPKYALLKPIYAQMREQRQRTVGPISRVLIYFGGGADEADITGQAVQAFDAADLADIHLDVVVSHAYAHLQRLHALSAKRGNMAVHTRLPDLADLMVAADLAIGAGGATTWERCCMGLPSIVISIAENQQPACEALAKAGFIDYLGSSANFEILEMQRAARRLVQDTNRLKAFSTACRALVDGKGAQEVTNTLFRDFEFPTISQAS